MTGVQTCALPILDISLPDVSGIEAARRMLAREPALRKARVCYDHLAGELGVTHEALYRVIAQLEKDGKLRKTKDQLRRTKVTSSTA